MSQSLVLRFGVVLTGVLLVGSVVYYARSENNEGAESAMAASAIELPRNGADLPPLPPAPVLGAARVALGERLFRDVQLSGDDTIACVSCHDLKRGGVDRLPVSVGVKGARGGINAPTVFNSSFNFVQFWDGRAATLEAQAAGPIHNPSEMASDWARVLPKLKADERYRSEFARIYPEGITADTIVDAIATFERSLTTPDSRFDAYLRGEATLSEDEITGYRRFRELGCTACHQGVLLGGNMYQKFGVLRDYFAGRTPTKDDMGRYNVTGREEDKHVFKVPGLRNVALTAPYFHDASAATLEQAVLVMARYQIGRDLAARDVDHIVAFLRSLNGQWNGQPLE